MDAIARTAARPRRPSLGRTARALGLLAAALAATAGAVSGPPAENPESTVRLISPIWARTVAPPESGSLRVTRSIAWMPLVPS